MILILFYLNIAANETKKKNGRIQECKKEKFVVYYERGERQDAMFSP